MEGAALPNVCRIPQNMDGAGVRNPWLFGKHWSAPVEDGSGLAARGAGMVATVEGDSRLAAIGVGMVVGGVSRVLAVREFGMVVDDAGKVWCSVPVTFTPTSGSIMTSSSASSLGVWLI